MEIRCIIVEDEPLALDRTKGYVQKLPFLTLLATFDNPSVTLVFLLETSCRDGGGIGEVFGRLGPVC